MQEKIEEKFSVFEIIASELVALNCLYSTNSDAIISKTENFSSIFSCIFEMCIKFGTFSKKRWPS